jgi:Tfp pilus assembly protein PilV
MGRPARMSSRSGRNPKDGGVALILVLLSMLVLSVLAATIVFTARSETLASYNFKLDTQADYLAKAGIQHAVNWFRSNHYKGVPHAQASTYYAVSATGTPWNLWTSNTSPVTCISGCSATNSRVQLITYDDGSGASNYPSINNDLGTLVATAFGNELLGVRVTGDANNSGTFSINAILLNYQTVLTGVPPSTSYVPVETWLITSKATWTGGSSMTATIATAEEQAIIQPIYVPTWGNALYGFCSVTMKGSSGVCTDAYNSSLGPYADGTNATAAGGCNPTTTTGNVISAGAGVGSNGGVTLGNNVVVSGDVTIGSGAPAGCPSGFSGSASSVLGQVVNGPPKPPPAQPTFRTGFPGAAPGCDVKTGGGGGKGGGGGGGGGGTTCTASGDIQILPDGATWPSPFVFPTSYSPVAGQPCMESTAPTCNGTFDHPFEIGTISMTNNSGVLQLIGSSNPLNPVYYDIDSLTQTQGSIAVSGYVVLNIKTTFSMAGKGISNGNASSIPPEYVTINYAGTNNVDITGNGALCAVINAPDATVTLKGSGTGGYMIGAIQANNIDDQGGYPVHYDIQLGRVGGTMGVPVTTAYNRKKM